MINSSYLNDISMNIIKYPIITDKATRLLANNRVALSVIIGYFIIFTLVSLRYEELITISLLYIIDC